MLLIMYVSFLFFFLMIRRPPRSTLLTHSFPTRRSSDLLGTGRMLDRLVAAGVIGVPVRVPDRIAAPAARLGGGEHRVGLGRIDHDRPAAVRVVDQPDIIFAERGAADGLERAAHLTTFPCW